MIKFHSYKEATNILDFAFAASCLLIKDVHRYLKASPHWSTTKSGGWKAPGWKPERSPNTWQTYYMDRTDVHGQPIELLVLHEAKPVDKGHFPERDAQAILDMLSIVEERPYLDICDDITLTPPITPDERVMSVEFTYKEAAILLGILERAILNLEDEGYDGTAAALTGAYQVLLDDLPVLTNDIIQEFQAYSTLPILAKEPT